MAQGDQNDMQDRLTAVLPSGWFPDSAPILGGLLAGCAAALASAFSLITYAMNQIRLATMTECWLDLMSQDYFNGVLPRRINEKDAAFKGRISRELFRQKVTRAAVSQIVKDATGIAPVIFEPTRPADTGAWGYQGMTVGSALAYDDGSGVVGVGGYGSLALPFQFFISAFRPVGFGIASVGGYYAGSGWAGGGYGVGAMEYVTLDMIVGGTPDSDVDALITRVIPVNTVAWVNHAGPT